MLLFENVLVLVLLGVPAASALKFEMMETGLERRVLQRAPHRPVAAEVKRPPSGVQLATRLLRDIPPASAALVAASVAGGEAFPTSLDPLVGLASVEFAFQLVRRAQIAIFEKVLSAQPALQLPGNETHAELWNKILDATDDVASFVEGWFVGSPRVEELSRNDVEDMISKNMFGRVVESLEAEELEQLQKMREALERALGRTFLVEEGPPRRVPIALAVDSIDARQHPLLMYAMLAVVRIRHRRDLDKQLGFTYQGRTPRKHLAYWVREGSGAEGKSEKTPIVFAHGIGVGLLPYARFVESLVEADPDRPIVLLELPAISTSLVTAPMATGAVLAEEVRAVLGDRECIFVAHSFGSTLAAFLAKYQPQLLAGLVLVEPVCFLLNLPKTTRRVFYDNEADPLLRMVSSDPNNAFSLRRRFWWQEAILLAETLQPCLKAPSTVFLAQDDMIVPTRDVQTYLQRKNTPKKIAGVIRLSGKLRLDVQIFEKAGHGRWQRTPDSIDRVVQASLDAAASLDRRRLQQPLFTKKKIQINRKFAAFHLTRTRRRRPPASIR